MAVPYVINLDRSVDRWEALQQDWKGAFPIQRVSAIEASPGWIGCALSHIKIIEEAKARGDPYVLVWEDDCIPRKRNGEPGNVGMIKRMWDSAVQKLDAHRDRWDIVLGASSRIVGTPTLDPVLSGMAKIFRIESGFTTHWTFYNASCYDTMIAWKATQPCPIDVYIFQMMRICVIAPFLAEQRPGYSIIEQKESNYTPLFDNAEKALKPGFSVSKIPQASVLMTGYSTVENKEVTLEGSKSGFSVSKIPQAKVRIHQ
jgi:hypothetical protein